jgi:hypothetical protein
MSATLRTRSIQTRVSHSVMATLDGITEGNDVALMLIDELDTG